MDRAPPELCHRIYSFACTDTGYTGRSLSLVSKYIHETSQPFRLQSISLHGHDEIVAFAALLDTTPACLRRVRYLFLSTQSRDQDTTGFVYHKKILFDKMQKLREKWANDEVAVQKDALMLEEYRSGWERSAARYAKQARQGPVIAATFEHILQTVASSLEILEVDLDDYTSTSLTEVISLPHLTDLTGHGGYPLMLRDPQTPLLAPCHNLRHLHIARTNGQLRGRKFLHYIATIGPCLTHLQLSGLQQDSWVGYSLKEALRVEKPTGLSAVWGSSAEWDPPVVTLPTTIQRILIKPYSPPAPGGRCGNPYMEYDGLLRGVRDLQEIDDRVTLLPVDKDERAYDSQLPISERDWLDRIAGGEGCWREVESATRSKRFFAFLSSGFR